MKKIITLLSVCAVLGFIGCEPEKDEVATKSAMEGVWQVTAAYDEAGDTITGKIAFPVTAFHLSSDHTIISTAGPMFMHVVYGNSKYTTIAASIDQVFNYAGLDFNGGEFFVAGGAVDRFTIEMKLEGLPGQKALTTLLDLIGVTQDNLDVVVYHKFQNVKVTFENDYNTMIWEFDDMTEAVYNTKDNNGNYVLWNGWPISSFMHGKFVLQKKSVDLTQVVKDAL
ncbi:MAG: hypothetical protein H6585_01620 [Flavobacteriales bacterium]|nr:hypothetical protein [Flavobacteriales bacterium]MCB9447025.1 hypothetical protein [Flavobacteriales bacterium]